MCVGIGVTEVTAVVIVIVGTKATVPSAREIVRGGRSLAVVAVWCPPSAGYGGGALLPLIMMFRVCSLYMETGRGAGC